MNKKILVFSFEPISNVMSNGRTLKNVLLAYKNEDIYNIYIHGIADVNGIKYCRISDKDAVKTLIGIKPKPILSSCTSSSDNLIQKQPRQKKRTNFKMIIRELVWSTKIIKKTLLEISKGINPDVILVFLGNGGFIMKNSTYVAKELNKPLVTFNCEDYYFKNYDYITYKVRKSLFHRIYKNIFVKNYDFMMNYASLSFYLTNDLKELYDNRFNKHNSYVLYSSSDIIENKQTDNTQPNKEFLYAGNVGIGRLDELIKVGEAIKRINPEYKLKIYCLEKRKRLLQTLKETNAFEFMGPAPYDEIVKKMKNAYAVLHVESSDPFYVNHTIHGFSTKIADCLSCGTCFIAKVSKESTIYHYLNEHQCAYVCSSNEEMVQVISDVIRSENNRKKYINNALKVASENHSAKNNSIKFKAIVDAFINNH